MIYGYIRVSSDKQTVENQRFEINKFCEKKEIERNLISQRTKEALARKKAEGVVLGRPKGRKNSPIYYIVTLFKRKSKILSIKIPSSFR